MLPMESDKGSHVVGILYCTVNRVSFVRINESLSSHSHTGTNTVHMACMY